MPPQTLPGPTGKSNRLSLYPKGPVLGLGTILDIALAQAVQALGAGCATVLVALARRDGAIAPLENQAISPNRYLVERNLCIDTAAADGNASLLARAQ